MTIRVNPGRNARVNAVNEADTINGIDYLEIVSEDQTELEIVFIHPLPGQPNAIPAAGPALTEANFALDGGERIKGIRIDTVLSQNANRLRLKTDQAGDFSTYTLRLVRAPGETDPPGGFDPRLAAVDFSFKAACASKFDCRDDATCPAVGFDEPDIDYLAKDYGSFRRLMLDRLSVLMPDWRDRSPADPYIALIEALAATADRLSYQQDAAATEAYLGTARSRISLRRHARLIDYQIHEGRNARTFIHVEVKPNGDADLRTLPAGIRVASQIADLPVVLSPREFDDAVRRGARPFETMLEIPLNAAHNQIPLYTWSGSISCLPLNATAATLVDTAGLSLEPGNFLLIEQICSPLTGDPADADPAMRHVVRLTSVRHTRDPLNDTKLCEVEWDTRDALPFALLIEILRQEGDTALTPVAIARGNIGPADHGLWNADAAVVPPLVPDGGQFNPRLAHRGITIARPADAVALAAASAQSLLQVDPRTALPVIRLMDENETWQIRHDLLGSDRFAADVVAEAEHDGTISLRFGDGTNGKAPSVGSTFRAAYRVGGGRDGNLGAGALRHVLTDRPRTPGFKDIVAVTNPVPATGGVDPESPQEIRRFAPASIMVQKRAVTEADYAAAAEQHEEVQRASARIRWTGSWYTVFITLDRFGGRSVADDAAFRQRLLRHFDQVRMAGYDLELRDPAYLPIDLELRVCVRPDHFQSDVKRALLSAFSARLLPDGRRGFFHPDNFSFGDPLYASRIHSAALAVDGVTSVELTTFKPSGRSASGEIAAGVITPDAAEIIRLDNDPSFPERGRFDCTMVGGL